MLLAFQSSSNKRRRRANDDHSDNNDNVAIAVSEHESDEAVVDDELKIEIESSFTHGMLGSDIYICILYSNNSLEVLYN